jgi:DNA-binding transcriptional ArsR family regulator
LQGFLSTIVAMSRNASVGAEALRRDSRTGRRYFPGMNQARSENVISGVAMAEIASLVGDPARANMLTALLSGQALSASDLAWHAGITPQTASGHLAKLAASGLLRVKAQGRHRYYRIAAPVVARMLEAINIVAAVQAPPRGRPPSRIDAAMCEARTCYDHLAGRLGVALADRFVLARYLELDDEAGSITSRGRKFFTGFGIDLAGLTRGRRAFCRTCLDWSERRPHISGALGAAVCARCFDLGWIVRVRDSRAVAVTAKGSLGLRERLGVEMPPSGSRHRDAGSARPD